MVAHGSDVVGVAVAAFSVAASNSNLADIISVTGINAVSVTATITAVFFFFGVVVVVVAVVTVSVAVVVVVVVGGGGGGVVVAVAVVVAIAIAIAIAVAIADDGVVFVVVLTGNVTATGIATVVFLLYLPFFYLVLPY